MRKEPQSDPSVERKRRERLVALIMLGVLLFNYPLLELVGASGSVFGIPQLFLYVFAVWAAFIWAVARVLGGRTGADAEDRKASDAED